MEKEPSDLGVKIGTPREVAIRNATKNAESSILNGELELEIHKVVLDYLKNL